MEPEIRLELMRLKVLRSRLLTNLEERKLEIVEVWSREANARYNIEAIKRALVENQEQLDIFIKAHGDLQEDF